MKDNNIVLEKHEVTKKQIFLGVGLILLYFSEYLWADYIPEKIIPIVMIVWNILLIFLAIIIYFNDLKRDFKLLLNNFKQYFPFCLKYWGILLGLNLFCSIIVGIFSESVVSVNQETINSLPLYYTIPASIIYAPIVEETIFRGVIRKLFKNNVLFVIVSALAFGFIHITSEPTLIMAVVHSLPYVSMGAVLAIVYVKTNNITASMTVHATQNTFSTILQLLIRIM